MRLRLASLSLTLRKANVLVDLSAHVTFFHGQSGSGKSSIVRLIDYCLGGDSSGALVISEELLSVALLLDLDGTEVLLERAPGRGESIVVSWRDRLGEGNSLTFPLKAGPQPIFGAEVSNFSDMMFHLLGVTPLFMMVREAGVTKPVRLSLRDLLWYCNLKQNELTNNFFNLRTQNKDKKSQKAFQLIVGHHSEKLSRLEKRIAETDAAIRGDTDSEQRIGAFLKELGYASHEEMQAVLEGLQTHLSEAVAVLQGTRSSLIEKSHPLDDLRAAARSLMSMAEEEQAALDDVRRLLADHKALRADLITMKFKLARRVAAVRVFSDIEFRVCPACGLEIRSRGNVSECALCGQGASNQELESSPDIVSADLDSRIDDLDESISRLTEQVSRQDRVVRQVGEEKSNVDLQLSEELTFYSSQDIAELRVAESNRARLTEQVHHLREIMRLPEALDQIREDVARLEREKREVVEAAAEERGRLDRAEGNVEAVEQSYKEALLEVRFPDFNNRDEIHINRKTWIPAIWPGGDRARAWTYYDETSGGKRTLLNVCYALAIHKVAGERGLQLPSLLILDTPTQFIDKDVDREMFDAFYGYLYGLCSKELQNTQVVIVENSFVSPPPELEFTQRYMTRDDSEHPPLVPYRLQSTGRA